MTLQRLSTLSPQRQSHSSTQEQHKGETIRGEEEVEEEEGKKRSNSRFDMLISFTSHLGS